MQTIEKIGKARKRTHERRRFSNRFDLIQTDGTKEKLSFTKNISKFRRSSLDVIFVRFCCCRCYWIVNRHRRILIYPFRINKANSNGQQTAERMGGRWLYDAVYELTSFGGCHWFIYINVACLLMSGQHFISTCD